MVKIQEAVKVLHKMKCRKASGMNETADLFLKKEDDNTVYQRTCGVPVKCLSIKVRETNMIT